MAHSYYKAQLGSPQFDTIVDIKEMDLSNGVLIRSTNWLGDAVMSLPAIYKLRQHLPENTKIYILCHAKLASLWQAVDWIDQVITFKEKRLDSETGAKLKALNPSLTIILPNSFGAVWDCFKLGLKNRVGCKGRGRASMLNYKLPAWKRVAGEDKFHQLNHYLSMMHALGIDEWNDFCPPLKVELDQQRQEELLPDSGEFILLAPAAAYGKAKQWPTSHFRKLADWWTEQNKQVIVIGAPGEEAVAEAVAEGNDRITSLAGKTSIEELMFLIDKARIVIANDSGTMHLAAALQKDGIAIFGSTDEIATGPVGGRWIIHRKQLNCSPCLERECPRTDIPYECLNRITSDEVIVSVEQLLREKK